nr:ribonuclease H-like domain, reverse transcriptase, RNA-dependent DNA polymerase [Tanacetum cinerariifolium]
KKEGDVAFDGKEHDAEKPESAVNLSLSSSARSGRQDDMTKKKDKGKRPVEYFTGNRDFNADFEDYFEDSSNNVSVAGPIAPTAGQNYSNSTNPISAAEREDIVYYDHENVGAEADFNNLETSITEHKRVHQALKDLSFIKAMQEELLQFKMQKFWILVDLPHGKRTIGTKWVYRNKKDERGIVVRNKARLVAQRHTQEEEIEYEEVFAPVARIKAIRLFLAYDSFMGFMVYQMDVKSEFLYGTIEEEVYVCQPSGFEDPDHPDKVYKVVKALYGLHQALRAWSMIGSLMYLTSSRPDIMFAVCACASFQVTPKASHLHAVKRIFRYLKGKPHLGLWYPKDSPFELVAYSDSDYAGASLDRKSTTRGCQFLRCRLICWQCKKQTVIATSFTEAEYVAGASCYAQVLWIHNQMLDYG